MDGYDDLNIPFIRAAGVIRGYLERSGMDSRMPTMPTDCRYMLRYCLMAYNAGQRIAELVEYCRRCGIESVMIHTESHSMHLRHRTVEEAEAYTDILVRCAAALRAARIEFGLNIWQTLGHHDAAFSSIAHFGWRPMVGHDGRLSARSPFPLALWPRTGARRAQSFPGVGPTVPFSDVPHGWPGHCVPQPMGMSDARIRWRDARGGAEVEVRFTSRATWDAFPILLWQPPILPSQLDGSRDGVQWMSARPQRGRVEGILLVGAIRQTGRTTWKVFIPGKPAAAREQDVVELTRELTLVHMPASLEPVRHGYLVKTRRGTADVRITGGVTKVETHGGEAAMPKRSFALTNESPYLRVWLKRGALVRVRAKFTPRRAAKNFSLEKDTEQLHDWVRHSVLLPTERLVFSLGCFRKCMEGTWGHPVQEDHVSITREGLGYETHEVDFGQAWAPGHTTWVQPWRLSLILLHTDGLKGKMARIHLHAYDYVPGLNRTFVVTANDRLPNGFSQWLIPEGPAARFSPQSVCSFSATDALLAEGKVKISLNSVLRHPVNDWVKDRAFSLLLADVWVSVRENP